MEKRKSDRGVEKEKEKAEKREERKSERRRKKKGTLRIKGEIRVAESAESCFKRNTPMLRTAQREIQSDHARKKQRFVFLFFCSFSPFFSIFSRVKKSVGN